MLRLFWAAILLSGNGSVAVPAAADIEETQPPSADEADRLVKAFYTDFYAKKFEQALTDISKLNPDASNPEGRAIVASMRAAALLGLKREPEAQQLIAEVRQLATREPTADSTLFESAVYVDRDDVAADALDDMIARFPDVVRDENIAFVGDFLRNEPKGQDQRNDDRRIALARIGYGGDTETGHYIAFNAVQRLMRRGDINGASDLLQYAGEPQIFENMLIQKRYAALWPPLEKLGGPHLAETRAASVASAKRAYEAAPDDHQKLQNYVNALRHAGRLEDAIALKSELPATSEAMAKADEPMGWAVNNVALSLQDAGRLDEADQLFELLNRAAIPDGGWRVSMMINRLELLVFSGKFQKAETLLDVTEMSAKNDGNPYAQQLVRRLRYCTLSALGKKDAATKVLPALLSHADDALRPTIDGLLCAGNIDKAEQLVLQGLNLTDVNQREAFEQDLVRALQPVALTGDDPSVWEGRWNELRKRPSIAAAYDRLGRDMPGEMLPEKQGSPEAETIAAFRLISGSA